MSAVTIGRLDARAVVDDPGAAGPLRERLTNLLTRAGRDHLDAALPADDSTLVCLRHLSVRLALSARGGDDDRTARQWAAAIADSIQRAVNEETAACYPDHAGALSDLVGSLSVGDRTRAWAWAMAGLWGPPDPVHPADIPAGSDRELANHALRRRRDEASTAVVEAALTHGLPAVHRLLGTEGWVSLAADLVGTATLTAARADDGTRDPRARPASEPAVATRLVAEVRRSRLVAEAPTRLAWAVVALADARPDLLAQPDAAAHLRLLTAELAGLAAPDVSADLTDPAEPGATLAAVAPVDVASAGSGTAPAVLPDALDEPDEPADADVPEPESDDPGAQTSPWAGLMFLTATAEAAGIPAEACADERIAARPQGEVMAGLAGCLAPVDESDPVVRVLAGTTQTPSETVPAWTADEAAALRQWAGAWASQTAQRLRGADPDLADIPDLTLVLRVAARQGLVEARPGWVEVTFDAADADSTVRAAGLDLDPGFLRWLGSVVRYRYV